MSGNNAVFRLIWERAVEVALVAGGLSEMLADKVFMGRTGKVPEKTIILRPEKMNLQEVCYHLVIVCHTNVHIITAKSVLHNYFICIIKVNHAK